MALGLPGPAACRTQPPLWPGVTAEPGGADRSPRGLVELPAAILGKPLRAVQRGNSRVVRRSTLAPSRCHGRLFLACDLALPFVLARVMLGPARWSDGGGARTTLKVTDAPQRAWGGRTWRGLPPTAWCHRPGLSGEPGSGAQAGVATAGPVCLALDWSCCQRSPWPRTVAAAALRQPGGRWLGGLERHRPAAGGWALSTLHGCPSSSGIGTHTVRCRGPRHAHTGYPQGCDGYIPEPSLGLSVRREGRFDMRCIF